MSTLDEIAARDAAENPVTHAAEDRRYLLGLVREDTLARALSAVLMGTSYVPTDAIPDAAAILAKRLRQRLTEGSDRT